MTTEINEPITVKQASELLNKPETTIKDWLKLIPIEGEPLRNSRGHRLITPENLNVLRLIKDLREEKAGEQTIRRKITPLLEEQATDEQPSGDDTEEGHQEASITASVTQPSSDAQAIAQAVVEAMRRESEVSVALSKATYQLGQAQEQVRHLTASVAERDEQIRELQESLRTGREAYAPMREEMDRLAAYLKVREEEAERLRSLLNEQSTKALVPVAPPPAPPKLGPLSKLFHKLGL